MSFYQTWINGHITYWTDIRPCLPIKDFSVVIFQYVSIARWRYRKKYPTLWQPRSCLRAQKHFALACLSAADSVSTVFCCFTSFILAVWYCEKMPSASGEQVSERKLYDLKEEAAKFFHNNRVPERLEEVLNSLFYEKPNDVYGRLVRKHVLFWVFLWIM